MILKLHFPFKSNKVNRENNRYAFCEVVSTPCDEA